MWHWEKNGWKHFYPKRVQWNRKTKLWLLFCRVGFGYSTKNLGRKGWEESRKRWLFLREERMAKCRQRLPGADNFRLSCRCWRCKLIEEKHMQRSCIPWWEASSYFITVRRRMKLVSLHVLSFLLSFEFRTLVLPCFTMFLLWVLLGFHVGSPEATATWSSGTMSPRHWVSWALLMP